MRLDQKGAPVGVDQSVPLAAVDLLPAPYPRGPPASVVITLRLSMMAANGFGLTADALAVGDDEGMVDALKDAVVVPSREPALGSADIYRNQSTMAARVTTAR